MKERPMRQGFRVGFLLLGMALTAHAGEPPVPLKTAPGHDVVENNCTACHSLDYLRTNANFLDRQGWKAEVNKMIKVFGADISPANAAVIVDYLARNYGAGN
jgi:sulfite dehydrogenase (cytochrome) subunit B